MSDQVAPGGEYPELLEHIAATVSATLVDLGLEVDQARAAGLGCAEAVRRHFGGQQLYIPMGLRYELSSRDREIYAKWNGRNDLELCREYNMSDRRLRQIVDAMREADRRGRQAGLF